ncbi:two component transcriptional regulator, LuxR family [Ruegeria halocynthiae]|uniref:Two component transcriptional regulator, LuxR family n=1 Tax=Ruegeria halocynthiae TaxID=985054 RepID=A0A1H3BMC9_9RHOB|nr:response regulator [Ruegeria halocynthiae]SDX42249.1 two component transcriptional regulator, LuxR family [Ruegeria halocynthiae]
MTSEPQVVFIVDDDEDVRIALSRSLRKRGMSVVHFADAQAFLDQVPEDATGCLILDYGMPGMDGLELQDHLVQQNSTIPIIFISGHGGIPESVRATKAGAIDFLEKPFDLKVLITRIQAAFEVGAQLRTAKTRRQMLADKRDLLTEREEQVLQHILTHPARTSSKEIATELGISPRTVEIHRGRIQQKIGVKTMIELFQLFGQLQ